MAVEVEGPTAADASGGNPSGTTAAADASALAASDAAAAAASDDVPLQPPVPMDTSEPTEPSTSADPQEQTATTDPAVPRIDLTDFIVPPLPEKAYTFIKKEQKDTPSTDPQPEASGGAPLAPRCSRG